MARISGFENERQIYTALNGKTLQTIEQAHLKDFVLDMFEPQIQPTDKITCEVAATQQVVKAGRSRSINVKQDLVVRVNGIQKNISVKKGNNNSVHEESIQTFISFLEDLGATADVIEALLKYQWADGTLDNTGNPTSRLKGRAVIDTYAKEMHKIHSFLNKYSLPIIKRALSIGTYDSLDSHVDYIYHGTLKEGVWCSLDYALSVNNNPDNTKRPIAVGFLTYQNQNRNTTLNTSKERARQQIQFKWSNMEAILEKSMKIRSRLQNPVKVIGNNRHGFENVNMIQLALNGSQIQNLRPNLKKFVSDLFPRASGSSIVTCEKIDNLKKGSLDITVGNKTTRVLIKSGTGNSVHQEEYQDFYDFLMKEFQTVQEIIDAFKTIQWGDGTLDGTGARETWLHSNAIKKTYPEAVEISNHYINSEPVARKLLHRFMVVGRFENERPNEYIYFGDVNSAYWASTKDLIDLQIKNRSQRNRSLLNIGNVNLQSWGRTIKKSSQKDQRESLQIKMPQLENDIRSISKSSIKKTYYEQGEDSERSFVQIYNSGLFKKETDYEQEVLMETPGYRYAVQVQTRQVSALTNKKEYTKSDTYFIETPQSLNELLLYERDFYIGEKDLEAVNYMKIPRSGVSIKRSDSKSFTYAKFSRTSFESLFSGKTELFVGALLYVQNEKDLPKNAMILKDNGITYEEMRQKFQIDPTLDELSAFRQMKNQAMEQIKTMIDSDSRLYEAIIFGTGIFKEPYCATYLYTDELVHKGELDSRLSLSVTTGSGRSKGKYTVIIKP